MASGVNDKYANMASIVGTVTASTYVFTELLTGISLGQGMGIIIDQLDYYYSSLLGDIDADGESITAALVTTNTIDNLDIDQKGVVHRSNVRRMDFGTAGSAQLVDEPFQYQFDPPIIVAAPRLYLGTYASAGISGTMRVRMYYRYIKLTSQEYLELAESFLLVG